MLKNGTHATIAVRLTLLAPDIVEEILNGRQPAEDTGGADAVVFSEVEGAGGGVSAAVLDRVRTAYAAYLTQRNRVLNVESRFAAGCRYILQKLNKQPAHFLRLLLLQPMSGSVYKVDPAQLRACSCLHPLECTRILKNAPIAFAADE